MNTSDMKTAVTRVAADAGVCPTTVTIAFCMTEDDDDCPWCVRIAMAKRSGRRPVHADAYGYGPTIADAAAVAIDDIAKYEATGFQRAKAAA